MIQSPNDSVRTSSFRLYQIVFFTLLLGVSVIPMYSQSETTTSSLPVSARALGLGGAYSPISDGGSAFAWNPAGNVINNQTQLNGSIASLHGAIGTSLSTMSWVGFSMPLTKDKLYSLSANWVSHQAGEPRSLPSLFGSSQLQRQQVAQSQLGGTLFFPQREDLYAVTFSMMNKVNLHWGWNQYDLPIEFPVGISFRYTRMLAGNDRANAVAFDLGGMMRININDMAFSEDYPTVSVSWALRNIGGSSVRWSGDVRNDINYHYMLGIALSEPLRSLDSDILLSYDYHSRFNGTHRIGLEWMFAKFTSVRAGLLSTTPTIGFGMDFSFLVLDYAYQFGSSRQLGDVHQLNAGFKLDKLIE
jgi:hypothetical protein